jgi:hypothetical protein
VVDSPWQIDEGDAVAETLIDPDTNTVTDADALILFFFVVTTFVVVTDGLTTMLAPVCPVLQT